LASEPGPRQQETVAEAEQRYGLRAEPSEPPVDAGPAEDDLVIGFNHSWSDERGVGLQGWAFSKLGPLEEVELWLGEHRVPIKDWVPRPDLRTYYPDAPTMAGFAVHVPRPAEHDVRVTAKVDGRRVERSARVSGLPILEPTVSTTAVLTLFEEFKALVNERHLSVLEIGSRIVSPGAPSKRAMFPGASRYVGFDYHPDDNTDIVGDAHRLSEHVGIGQFDAIFSLSVLEHLAMPWVAAMEINKALVPGGIAFHCTHFAWPAHDLPWDFWRFSDEGLKAVFSPALGYRTIKAGMYTPVRLHPDDVPLGQEMLPLHTAYGGSAILSEKIAEIDGSRFRWQTSLDEVLSTESQYPIESGLVRAAEG
jgi:hypothetical protein